MLTKSYLSIIVFFICSLFCEAQLFTITPNMPNSQNSGQIYTLFENELLFHHLYKLTNNDSAYTDIARIKLNGEVIKIKTFNYPIYDILPYSPDSIYLLYNKFNPDNKNYTFIELVDKNFELINKDSIEFSDLDTFRAKLKLQNNSILFYSDNYIDNIYKSNLTIGYINKGGYFEEGIKTMKFDYAGVLDVLVNKNKEHYIFCLWNRIVILDSLLNYKEELSFSDVVFNKGYHSIWTSENTFITGGNSFYNELVIKETDTTFKQKQSLTFQSNYENNISGYYSCIAKTDSFYYFTGTKNIEAPIQYLSPENTIVYVACIDKNFNIVWEKEFGNDAFYYVNSICTTPNNECLVLVSRDTADIYSNENELVMLRLDKNGNTITTITLDTLQNSIDIYPNPGNNHLNININENMQNALFNLYNISGKKIISSHLLNKQSQLSTSHLPKGVYIYEIINNKKLLQKGKWIKQ